MNKIIKKLILISIGLYVLPAQAINLLDVYKQAMTSDPIFQGARSQWMADRENIGINRGYLLPSLGFDGSYGATLSNDPTVSQQYTLTLTQPIFNAEAIERFKQAKSSVKSSTATFVAAQQDLISRTTQAYLDVLEKDDVLRYTIADRQSYYSQLTQTKAKFKVGLATATELNQIEASYDDALAKEISARNDLDVSKEKLSEITGQVYPTYAELITNLPLILPDPTDINQWVQKATQQNYVLQAAQYNLETAREEIKLQRAGFFPQLNAEGQYQHDQSNSSKDSSLNQNENTVTAGLAVNFPVFQGGTTVAKTKQAEYKYEKVAAQLEQERRNTISQTRQAYLGVMSKISEVKATQQAVKSANSSYESTKAAYQVGIGTMIDVLQQQTALYQAEKNLTTAQYDYLKQTLALKQAAGTLNLKDVQIINSWLREKLAVNISVNTKNPDLAKALSKPTLSQAKDQSDPQNTSTFDHNRKHRWCNKMRPEPPFEKQKGYTIQVMAARTQQELTTFINSHPDLINSKIYFVTSNNQPWYILTTGDYPSLSEAQQAQHQLPPSIRAMQPWIRSFKNIEEALNKN